MNNYNLTDNLRTVLTAGLFAFISLTAFAQTDNDTVFIRYDSNKSDEKVTYKTDTIIFDTPNARQILYGTTVLPWTYNQQLAKNFGLYLDKVSITECKMQEDEKGFGHNEVSSVLETDTTIKIVLKIFGNCCHSFLCDIEVKQDSIINLIYYSYGATYCSCDCCYGLTYNFSKLVVGDDSNYYKLKMVIINNDKRILKRK